MNQIIPGGIVHPTFLIGLLLQFLYGVLCVFGPLTPSSSSPYNSTAQLLQTILRLTLTSGLILTPVIWLIYFFALRFGYSWRALCTFPILALFVELILTYLFYKFVRT